MAFLRVLIPAVSAIALALPGAALAKNENKGHFPQASQGCPPGLAKKSPACVPPGQARQVYRAPDRDGDHHDSDHSSRDRDHQPARYAYPDRYDQVYDYRIGDHVQGNYVILPSPGRYGLNPNATYYQINNQIYQVNRETSEILAIIGLAQRLLN